MQKKIFILGQSEKFITIIKNLYVDYQIKIFSWRRLGKHKNYRLYKKPDIVFICGYDYNSQWYNYTKYYKINVLFPLKFINKNCDKNTLLFYVDTIRKIKKKNINKNLTLSRYEFAKSELRNKLIKNYNKIQIIELPPIVDKNLDVSIFGNKFTKLIFKSLILTKLIESKNIETIKSKFSIKNNFNKKYKTNDLQALMLNIPRPLFVDRFLRIISD